MIPHAPAAIRMLSQRILTQIVPGLNSPYSMSDGAMTAMLLNGLAQEMEDGIARRLADIESMKVIFRRSLASLPAGAVPDDLAVVLESAPQDMSMSAVNAVHDAHSRVLIRLHEAVEVDNPSDAQRVLNLEIWTYLGEFANRHRLAI
jgi:hypothetical protein